MAIDDTLIPAGPPPRDRVAKAIQRIPIYTDGSDTPRELDMEQALRVADAAMEAVHAEALNSTDGTVENWLLIANRQWAKIADRTEQNRRRQTRELRARFNAWRAAGTTAAIWACANTLLWSFGAPFWTVFPVYIVGTLVGWVMREIGKP